MFSTPNIAAACRNSPAEFYLSDGGLETTLIFHDGFELPMFAAFTLIESERGRAALRAYYDRYVSMAVRHGTGFILESPTWRANPDWGAKLGYDRDDSPPQIAPPST